MPEQDPKALAAIVVQKMTPRQECDECPFFDNCQAGECLLLTTLARAVLDYAKAIEGCPNWCDGKRAFDRSVQCERDTLREQVERLRGALEFGKRCLLSWASAAEDADVCPDKASAQTYRALAGQFRAALGETEKP